MDRTLSKYYQKSRQNIVRNLENLVWLENLIFGRSYHSVPYYTCLLCNYDLIKLNLKKKVDYTVMPNECKPLTTV